MAHGPWFANVYSTGFNESMFLRCFKQCLEYDNDFEIGSRSLALRGNGLVYREYESQSNENKGGGQLRGCTHSPSTWQRIALETVSYSVQAAITKYHRLDGL